ncbi:MAG TPA: hypothetical protein VMA73_21750 [Streptosporangiaceae bacterium]|nr:hypothetical protein [Streptosporangiaceae bacterium]
MGERLPAISVAVPALGPVGLSVARLTVASLALALVCPFMKVRRPRARDLPLTALCGLAAYQLLLNTGERVRDSKLYNTRAIINACIPYDRLVSNTFPPVAQSAPGTLKAVRQKWAPLFDR